jgi:excinuclease ABC subunit A
VVIAAADYVVELGPEGGEAGGRIVAAGTPAEVARASTPTAPVLRQILGDERRQRAG